MHTTSASRIDYQQDAAGAMQAMLQLENYVKSRGIEPSLYHLVKLRASLINGCTYCIDMHTREALADGESDQRLAELENWQESQLFTDRERAAFTWTDSVTDIIGEHASDESFEAVKDHFQKTDLVNLTMLIVAINSWNRLAISFRM